MIFTGIRLILSFEKLQCRPPIDLIFKVAFIYQKSYFHRFMFIYRFVRRPASGIQKALQALEQNESKTALPSCKGFCEMYSGGFFNYD